MRTREHTKAIEQGVQLAAAERNFRRRIRRPRPAVTIRAFQPLRPQHQSVALPGQQLDPIPLPVRKRIDSAVEYHPTECVLDEQRQGGGLLPLMRCTA